MYPTPIPSGIVENVEAYPLSITRAATSSVD
jgi:hypothetical protein